MIPVSLVHDHGAGRTTLASPPRSHDQIADVARVLINDHLVQATDDAIAGAHFAAKG